MEKIPSRNGTLLKDTITKKFIPLCNAIDCNDTFLTGLRINRIITAEFESKLKSLHSNLDKASRVLEFLRDSRTDSDFTTFVNILKTSCNSKAVNLVTEPLSLASSIASYGYQGVVADYIERKELQQQALEHLRLKPNKEARITFPVVVLHGFGGNGKSQMARRLVQILTKESIPKCTSVWINAISDASVIEGFRNFGAVGKGENVSIRMGGNYKEWKDRNLLLVFDDGDDFEMIKKYLPLDDNVTNVRVIVTAHGEWVYSEQNVKNIPVSNFTVDEFTDFVAKAVGCAISTKDAKQLEGHTGRIPAILSLVCKGFSQRLKRDFKYTISKYFLKFGDKIFTFGEDGMLIPGLKECDYKKSAKIAVEQQLSCMENWNYESSELIELAKFILNCIAYCDPAGISNNYFFTTHPQIFRKAQGNCDEIRQALGILIEFGWIELKLEGESDYYVMGYSYSMRACYQIGLKSQLSEQTSEFILHGMIEYIQVSRATYLYKHVREKYCHLAIFFSHIYSHSKRTSLLNHATETNHCMIGLAEKGFTNELKFLASVYKDQRKLVHALLQSEHRFPSSPMYYLFREGTNHELVMYFILEIKGYYDYLKDPEKKAWIRYNLLLATTGVLWSNYYKNLIFTLDSFDLNVSEGLGKCRDTLLHSAVNNINLEFVQLLIKKGANVNEKNARGETPLHRARDLEVARVLLSNGANIHEKTNEGETALHKAIWNLEVVQLFIEKGANVNEKDFDGETPLHKVDRLEIVKFLVENGANIYATNGEGKTPLQVTSEMKYTKDVVNYFLSINP